MANYSTESDVKAVFGTRSTERWADLDGDANATTITNRISWANTLATEWINSRLTRGPYEVPFTSVPTLIVNLAAMKAGILLHDGRQVISGEQFDQVAHVRKHVHCMIRQIQSGQIKLLDPSSSEELECVIKNRAPFVADVSDTDTDDTLVFGS